MSPFVLLSILTACSRPPASQAVDANAPREFVLVYEGNLAGELEPCG